MWFSIDFNSHVPVYKQIKEKIKSMIVTGKLKKGAFVPSIRSLAKDLGVNLNTVSRAYRELVLEGILKVVRGEGYVVEGLDTERFLGKKLEEFRKMVLTLKGDGIEYEKLEGILREVYGGEENAES
ncbi:MAG: GntR family transcriptional regulator [Candidatus Syntropharchaeia archaeon]